ncbi:MAG TPA: N-acetylmuramoyl-L-alanine amidase [Planococcus sp. (in: firmicutes)]|nr:N-acetylmuramoyl-L-alanine amidase [Planococcus sp. (in: firmicutes)]
MKKWIMMLCFALVASVLVPQSHVNASTNFKDIGTSHRAYAEIDYLVNLGYVNGISSTHFVPSQQVTRAQAAAMLGRSLKLDGTQRATKFNDVSSGNFASGYITEMVNKGIINGYPDNTFRPYKVLTRGEMAVLINKAFNFGGTSASSSASVLMKKGIAQGLADGTFGSTSTIIRADFAVFLARSLNEKFRIQTGDVSFSKTMYVNTPSDVLNLRSAPSTSGTVLARLPHGSAVAVAGSANGWSHVRVNGLTGYVATSLLASTKPSSVIPVAASDLTVIIDPGHGGTDPGASGYGFQEKNVVLNIGNYMKKYYDQIPVNVKLTRSTDVFMELSDRARYASRNGGDIFVSLHTNAFNTAANGQETFYYAKTAATNPHVAQSRALAIYLQARMQSAWDLTNRGVNPFGYGNFAVLRENTVPAALIEMGFIDNSKDIQFIKQEAERQKMAKHLVLATLDYFYHYEKRSDVLPYYSKLGASPSKKLH